MPHGICDDKKLRRIIYLHLIFHQNRKILNELCRLSVQSTWLRPPKNLIIETERIWVTFSALKLYASLNR